ncbi:hypothetical protein GQD96_00795 [Mycobacterium tuberculosis]|nr:hypothetical protein [Mycobacterium tuberculosis]
MGIRRPRHRFGHGEVANSSIARFRQGPTPVSTSPDRAGLVAPSPLCPET